MLQYPDIDPIIFHLGPLPLRWYSLMYIIGLTVVYLFFRNASKKGRLQMTYEQIESIMVWGIAGMILGARLTYVFVYNFDHYKNNLQDLFSIWNGGLSFHGAFGGIALAVLLFCRRHKISYFNVTDHICTAVPVGLGFGRIGNFINGELWGRVSDVPWAMVFPGAGPLPRHPSQLYESILEGWVLLAIMIFAYTRKPKRHGILTGIFIQGYATFRFFVEFFREPDSQLGTVLGPFSMGQVLCAIMWLFGCFIIVLAMNHKSGSQDNPLPSARQTT